MSRIDVGNIGDYANNKILDWNPISFAIEFIYQMRRNKGRLQNIPSTRQAIAIPKLLTAMYHRKCNLIPEDFITAAVITTPIEDQAIAREIAFNIIFGDPKSVKKAKKRPAIPQASADEKTKFMDELLEVFENELDLGNLDTDELIEEAMEELSGLMDFVNDIYDRAEREEEPYKSLLDIIEQRYNYRHILEQGLKDLNELEKECHQIILREINDLSPLDISSAVKLNWGTDIIDQSTVPWITLTAKYLMNSKDFKPSLNDIMKKEEVGTSARTLDYLDKVGMDKQEIDILANQLIGRIENLMDVFEISKILQSIPPFDHDKVLKNSLNENPTIIFNITRQLDTQFHSHLTNELFQRWAQKNPSPSLSELFQAQTDLVDWQNMLDTLIDQKITEYLNTNGRACYNLADLACELMNLSNQAKFDSCRNALIKNAKKVGMKALEASHDSEQFETVLKAMVSDLVPLNQSKAIEIGKKLGVPETTIIEIFGGDYKLLKTLYKQNIGNFDRYSRIIKKIKLTEVQMEELMEIALNKDNYQGLGALSHSNLSKAFKIAKKYGGQAERKVAESLSAGSGENMLVQWFFNRNKVPRHLKEFVKNLCKDALIKIAMNIISNQRGSGTKGLIPSNQLRPYIIGDDIELINIDATIENIIMQGKSLEMVIAEDLLVTKTEKGRVSICFLLDISGSMYGMKLAACSIAVMVLIGSLRADEVAICFFESNTHVVKEFGDERNLDDVANELLDLSARGGTCVQEALRWGARELEKTQTERKLCFLLTDCAFSETEEMIKHDLEEYINQRVQFILGVNTRSYYEKCAKWILEITKGEIVHILHIMDIPKVLTEVLDKIG
ncbi:MAG: putative VWA domain containing CoxE-like protein [Promethearchaeota archaeon]|nr:MAG: putative VWA domain containing CoxE-like protein [Candidatus Lokiarchaeota archaeon]